MKALILDGSRANDLQAIKITHALREHLPNAETIILREQKIGNWPATSSAGSTALACATQTLHGRSGWRQAAKRYGMEKELRRQPYLQRLSNK